MFPYLFKNGNSLISNSSSSLPWNLFLQKGVQVPETESIFSCTNTFFRRFPSYCVRLIRRDNVRTCDDLGSLGTKDIRDEISILVVRFFKSSSLMRQRRLSNRQIEMIVNGPPDVKPRGRPNTGISFVNLLNHAILSEAIVDLKNGGPKG